MELQVSFRGKPVVVAGVGGGTAVEDLKEKLEELTGVPVANQKLILKGKALHDDADTLQGAGVFVASPPSSTPPPPPSTTTTTPEIEREGTVTMTTTLVQKSKLLLVGSKPSEVEEVMKGRDMLVRNDLAGVAVPKGYKKVALNHPSGPSELSPYRFQRIETLPGLPEEETARKILESLAADPGIRAVLEKHQWTVGALCELYPEGKVGVSDTCVMGLNQNYGMKILLRLRTDDLKGFRKILSIRKVLFHELAHNEVGPHNDDFYRLMRQVEKEAAELDWTQQSGGKTVAGRRPGPRAQPAGLPDGGGGYILVKEAFEGGSGRLGGDSNALTHIFSATQMAGQAAVQRLTPEEQEVEDCCGHTEGNADATAAATAATATLPAASVLAAAAGDASVSPSPAHERPSAEKAVASLVSEMSVASDDGEGADEGRAVGSGIPPPVGGGGDGGGSSSSRNAEALRESASVEQQRQGVTAMDVAEDDADQPPAPLPQGEVSATSAATTPPAAHKLPSSLPPPSPAPLAQASAAPAPTPTPAPASPSPLDELLAMGFPRDAAAEALAASGGSIPDAAYRLLTPNMASNSSGDALATSAAAEERGGEAARGQAAGGGRSGGSGEGEVRLPRDVRLQRAADRIGGNGDRARAVQCLDVLASIFRNIMEHPEEEKFRKVRRSNGKFKASVGAVPGGVDILLAAGFEERPPDQLELGRQDPGLIWLAKSTVEAWQERLSSPP
eukprot:g5160.t1